MTKSAEVVTVAPGPDGAEAQLQSYIDKLEPKPRELFRALRASLRKRFPTANELAYDYGFALVIGYAPAQHGIDAIVALRASATAVSLYFNQGPKLPDPKRLLKGSAKLTRFIEIAAASELAHPDIEALIAAAITHATVPLPATGVGTLTIKTDSAKKAPRKKSSK